MEGKQSENTAEPDKAAEAREARRKRLLESANKRLGKITGREHNEGRYKSSWKILKFWGDVLIYVPTWIHLFNDLYL